MNSEQPPAKPETDAAPTAKVDLKTVPRELRVFAKHSNEGKTPAQFFEKYGASSEQNECIAGLMSGLLGDFGVPIPPFAKEASKQFWKYYVGKDFDADESLEDAGVIVRMLEHFAPDFAHLKSPLTVSFESAVAPMVSEIQKAILKLPPEQTAAFYAGRARAEKIIVNMSNPDFLKMQKRAPLYVVLSVAWKQFEKFKSRTEAERWLRSEKVISDNMTWGEIGAVFRLVGLHYRPQGRPKK